MHLGILLSQPNRWRRVEAILSFIERFTVSSSREKAQVNAVRHS
jgi:hypothetical protein